MRGRWRQLRCRANWRTVLSCFPFFTAKKVACLYGAQASNPSHEPLGEVRYDRLYADLIARYCDPATVPCEVFEVGDEFIVDRKNYFRMEFEKPFCSEAWHAISPYVFTMVQGGEPTWAVNHTILACCNDGARPVVFKLERIDD